MLVRTDGGLAVISKLEREDPDAAAMLLLGALFESFDELVEQARPDFEANVARHVVRKNEEARRILVRGFIEKRLAGEPVEGYLESACHLTIAEGAVSKSLFGRDNKNTPYWDARGKGGRFVPANAQVNDENGNPTIDMGAYLMRDDEGSLKQGAKQYLEGKDRYERAKTVGQGLRAAGTAAALTGNPGGAALGTAGIAAGVYGNLGPEAEKILGPGLRRTAYRYRGTEKTPDRMLRGTVGSADAQLLEDYSMGRIDRADLSAASSKGNASAVEGVMAAYDPNSMSPDQLALRVRGDLAAGYFARQVPNPEKTRLSIAAGQVPPSKGAIIDADGDVVTEAMGFNGDHYLPFDLKNLRRLQGGQYVRTRAAGGPTTEDIYTGLLTGARQVQVASNSGVFTVEFDPDLRGGRRYSDKARQMIGRYEKLLATVEGGSLYRQDVPASRQRELRREIADMPGMTAAQAEKEFTTRLEEERFKLSYGMDDDEIDQIATEQVNQMRRSYAEKGTPMPKEVAQQKFQETRQELISEAKENAVRQYRLDGVGYDAALRSLQEEFPYFIRSVDYQALPEFMEDRKLLSPGEKRPLRGGGVDRGYVKPGQTNAVGANVRVRDADKAKDGEEVKEETGTTGGSTTSTVRPLRGQATGTVPLSEVGKAVPRDAKLAAGVSLSNVAWDQWHAPNAVFQNKGEGTFEQAMTLGVPTQTVEWLVQNKGNDAVDFLLDPTTPQPFVDRVLKGLSDAAESNPKEIAGSGDAESVKAEARAARDALTPLLAMRAPFRTGGDVLAPIDPAKDGPLDFKEITEAAGSRTANYNLYLESAPDEVKEAVRSNTLKDLPNKVATAASELQAIVEWGKAGGQGTEWPKAPKTVDGAMARAIANNPAKSQQGKQLEALQKAWTFHQARSVAEAYEKLTGLQTEPLKVPAAGKAPAPAAGPAPLRSAAPPSRQAQASGGFKKRHVRVARLGSPEAQEIRKRLGLVHS